MPRAPRLDFPGAQHHIMNRGARREAIFEVEGARRMFLDLLAELPLRFGVGIHAYALMPNHYHLQVTSPECGLSKVMKRLDQVFTQRLNHRHDWDGPVFRGRYHDVVVGDPAHWEYLPAYIHGNPVRSGYAGKIDDPLWTSHACYAGAADGAWLDRRAVMDRFPGPQEYRDWLQAVLEQRVPAPDGFAPESWGGPRTEIRPVPCRPLEPTEALALLECLAGAAVPQGRSRHPLGAVACWWMRSCGIRVVDAAEVLGVSTATVVRRTDDVARLVREDAVVASWIAVLTGDDPRARTAA